MAYYGYGRRRYRSWRARGYQPTRYTALWSLFGEVVQDIKKAFFQLEPDAIEELFSDYGNLYGPSAETYARKTFPAWQRGSTGLSGQTMERLIELVPPYLTPEQRMGVLAKLVHRHKPPIPQYTVRIDTKDSATGIAELENRLATLRVEDNLANLPQRVMDAAKWLYDDDITAARAVMAEFDKRKNDLMRDSAVREVQLLTRTILSGQIKAASYKVELPAGAINVVVYQKSACFIATAVFGEDACETILLRRLRDELLLERCSGRHLVVAYYRLAPSFLILAKFVPGLRLTARGVLRAMIWVLKALTEAKH